MKSRLFLLVTPLLTAVLCACSGTEQANEGQIEPVSSAGTYLDRQAYGSHSDFQAKFKDASTFCAANQAIDGTQSTVALIVKADGTAYYRKLSPVQVGQPQQQPGFHAEFIAGVADQFLGQITGPTLQLDPLYRSQLTNDLGAPPPAAYKIIVTRQNLAFINDAGIQQSESPEGTVPAQANPPQQSIYYRVRNSDYELFKANFLSCPLPKSSKTTQSLTTEA